MLIIFFFFFPGYEVFFNKILKSEEAQKLEVPQGIGEEEERNLQSCREDMHCRIQLTSKTYFRDQTRSGRSQICSQQDHRLFAYATERSKPSLLSDQINSEAIDCHVCKKTHPSSKHPSSSRDKGWWSVSTTIIISYSFNFIFLVF